MSEHKRALITGGAHRIGRAIVEDLAANGYAVAIHAHGSADEADELADALSYKGCEAVVVSADLTDMAETRALMPMAIEALGGVDLLVNNASIFENDTIHDVEDAQWETHFAIHTKAPVFLTQAFANQTGLENPMVVNIIDERVWRLGPNFFSYTLSKAALWTATQTMAQALAPRIRVNAIGPGPTLPNSRQTQQDFDRQVAAVPLQVSPALEDFGRTIRYLHETPSITGQMIALDGGQHLAWETPDVVGINE